MDITRISIVLPAFNEATLLGHTLARIHAALQENQDAAFVWEVIVCDNNSSDQTAAIASQTGARVVFEPINQISRARNTGAAAAEGDWLLFIDADSFPPPPLIAEVLTVIRAGTYVGCGSTVTAEGGSLWNRLRIERLNPFFRLFNWCGGVFILCHRGAFQAIGGFSLGLYALEEIDFVLRLKRYGRAQGKRFTILHRHPVITSGRKGDLTIRSVATLITSTIMSVVLLGLYFVLPKKLQIKGSSRLLGFWYNPRDRGD